MIDEANYAQLAQADTEAIAPSDEANGEGQGKGPSYRLETDFEKFQRELQREQERVAAEEAAAASAGRQGAAPPTEPDPGSREYQAADAEARRIVAEQEQQPPRPERADAPRTPDNGQAESEATPPSRPAEVLPDAAPPLVVEPGPPGKAAPWRAGTAVPFPPGTIGPDLAPISDALGKAASSAAGAAPRLAGALAAAGFILLKPGNTQSETHAIGDGLRVRTAPGQRSATVELRVGEGLLGTGIGERWKALPEVRAEWVLEPGARRYIAIDRRGLEAALGRDAAEAALGARGIAMAKPPSGDKPNNERPPPGTGHNNPPEPLEPKPPLNPAPLVAPIVKKNQPAESDDKDKADDARRREIRETAEYIGSGHAAEEHLGIRREYPGMSQSEFIDLIDHVMTNPTVHRTLPKSGREAYWDERSKLLVVRDPLQPDRGTAFKHPDGRTYIKTMKDR
jgi:hypothetical protein